MIDNECLHTKYKPFRIPKYLAYKFGFAKEHPDYFGSDGILLFCGPQGSGKTLSAVLYVYRLMEKYPKAILVTNLYLRDYPFDNERVFVFNNNDDFSKYSNGERGVIYLIDEIQLYMNSLQSKNINMDVMTQISQQRKQRKHIVCTSQVFGRMAKPLREQFSTVVVCKNVLGLIQYNRLIDRDDIESDDSSDTKVTGVCKKRVIFIHDVEYYKRYDTMAVIKPGMFKDGEGNIYGLSTNN